MYVPHPTKLVALDASDGTTIWEYPITGGCATTPAVDDYGNIHIITDNPSIYHVVRPNGNAFYISQSLGTSMWSSPVITEEGIIIFLNREGSASWVRAYDIQGVTGPADSPWPQRTQNAARTSLQK